jgi:hypothetical protein
LREKNSPILPSIRRFAATRATGIKRHAPNLFAEKKTPKPLALPDYKTIRLSDSQTNNGIASLRERGFVRANF